MLYLSLLSLLLFLELHNALLTMSARRTHHVMYTFLTLVTRSSSSSSGTSTSFFTRRTWDAGIFWRLTPGLWFQLAYSYIDFTAYFLYWQRAVACWVHAASNSCTGQRFHGLFERKRLRKLLRNRVGEIIDEDSLSYCTTWRIFI